MLKGVFAACVAMLLTAGVLFGETFSGPVFIDNYQTNVVSVFVDDYVINFESISSFHFVNFLYFDASVVVEDGYICIDVPERDYRIIFLKLTPQGISAVPALPRGWDYFSQYYTGDVEIAQTDWFGGFILMIPPVGPNGQPINGVCNATTFGTPNVCSIDCGTIPTTYNCEVLFGDGFYYHAYCGCQCAYGDRPCASCVICSPWLPKQNYPIPNA